MNKLLIVVALLAVASTVSAGDCEKLAAFKRNNAEHLQFDYMRLKVPAKQWGEFLKASTKMLDSRYNEELAKCKKDVQL